MTRLVTAARLAVAAALFLGATGCASAPVPITNSLASAGELEAATPQRTAVGRADNEMSVAVALGARRERVRDAVDGYLRAVVEHHRHVLDRAQ